ncbi:TonB-dependent receptor [Massilia sp. B-10]|nr:TonB-dependent receptor [Massilia sp. B-10]
MIDGRSVYSPLFSGVFWEVQEVMLEDVERIEVISGPGGTLWGVNAVNGVINIMTRHASETHGTQVSLRAGSRGSDSAFRQGGASGGWDWRVYGKYQDVRRSELAAAARSMMRATWPRRAFGPTARGADRYTVGGSAYKGRSEQPLPGSISTGEDVLLGPISSDGVNLTASWRRALDGGAELALQAYLDYSKRDVVPSYAESLTIADLQFQHSLAPIGAHRAVWGANLRRSRDDVTHGPMVAFLPAQTGQTWASLFAQDEIALAEALRLTLGARRTQRLHGRRSAAHAAPGMDTVGRAFAVGRALAHGARAVPPRCRYLHSGGAALPADRRAAGALGSGQGGRARLSWPATHEICHSRRPCSTTITIICAPRKCCRSRPC